MAAIPRIGGRHRAFYVAAALGALVALLAWPFMGQESVVVAANAFFASYLAMTAFMLPRLTADYLARHAADADAPAPLIFATMAGAVAASVAALFLALSGQNSPVQVALAIVSVVLGWFAIHTMWAMHYAYEYYEASDTGERKGRAIAAGLEFPGCEEPDGLAFLYFGYVIGMTAQTSDTEVTTNAMRRIVTAQSVFAFFFNTVLVAAAVNIAVSLGH